MLVLGIADGHDAGACLVRAGRLICAVSEERLTGRKRQAGWPGESVAWCLAFAGAAPRDVDAVAIAEVAGRAAPRLLDSWYRRTNPNLPMNRATNRIVMRVQNGIAAFDLLARLDAAASRFVLRDRLRRHGIAAPVALVDHHAAHAMSAAAGSGFAAALVVTMDAFGDGLSSTVWRWSGGELVRLAAEPFPHSAALLYGLVTAYLGFAEGEEGQVAGLAATADPTRGRAVFAQWLQAGGSRLRLWRVPAAHLLRRALAGLARAEIAAGLQAAVQDAVAEHIRYWIDRTGLDRLVLAGGLFANVRLNQVVAARAGAGDLFVFPHMGDGGLCAGAAWLRSDDAPVAPETMFLGPEAGPSPETLPGFASRDNDAAVMGEVARLLRRGGIVGIAAGRQEFGPRALGHRSLLFAADHPETAARLGDALARPALMPFAPVVREGDFATVTATPRWRAFDHMTVTADARAGVADRHPVAVHADGTLRLQAASPEREPLLHAILTACAAPGDPPLLINSSFNRHREPIVTTAARAAELAAALRLDCLVTADRVLVRQP
jgi:carbamoyltransferase